MPGGSLGSQPAKRQRRADVLESLGEAAAGAGFGGGRTALTAMKPPGLPLRLGKVAAVAAVPIETVAPDRQLTEPACKLPPGGSTEEPSSLPPGMEAKFANAKDKWDIDAEVLRGFFWHSETGGHFEWDQGSGTLFQYMEAEKEEGAKPTVGKDGSNLGLYPIWSVTCPEQHAWVWELLPLPPSDPAAQAASAVEQGIEPCAVAITATTTGSSGSGNEEQEGEQRGGAMQTHGPELPRGLGGDDDDDDEDEDEEEMEAVEPLAQGEISALPPPPMSRAEPSACDLDLDMFGALEGKEEEEGKDAEGSVD